MQDYTRLTPEGTKDVLFEAVASQHAVSERLRQYMTARGYREVRTPSLEYYDIFQSRRAHFAQESLYKLTDRSGRLVVLRPDSTIPMARLAANKLREAPAPLRLFYDQPVYRVSRSLDGLSHERRQMGLEIIGAEGRKADLEVLAMAAGLFQELGFEDFRLELGHVLPVQALLDRLAPEPEDRERITQAIADKNESALERALAPWREQKEARLLRSLPRLFGSEDVLTKALDQLDSDQSDVRAALDELQEAYDALDHMGLADHTLIDLGLVREADYYTGTVFRAYLGGAGREVLSGGRYDSLLEEFGSRRPAVGFGVELDLVSEIWLREHQPSLEAPILYYAEQEFAAEALAAWPDAPGPLLFSHAADLDQAREEAHRLGAKELWIHRPSGLLKEDILDA